MAEDQTLVADGADETQAVDPLSADSTADEGSSSDGSTGGGGDGSNAGSGSAGDNGGSSGGGSAASAEWVYVITSLPRKGDSADSTASSFDGFFPTSTPESAAPQRALTAEAEAMRFAAETLARQLKVDVMAFPLSQFTQETRLDRGSSPRRSPDRGVSQTLWTGRRVVGTSRSLVDQIVNGDTSGRRDPLGKENSASSYVLFVPKRIRDELAAQLPGVAVVGFSPEQAEDLAAHIADVMAAFRVDQELQLVKLEAELSRLRVERDALINQGEPLSDEQQARLAEIEGRLGELSDLVRFCQLAIAELNSIEQAVQQASNDVTASRSGSGQEAAGGSVEVTRLANAADAAQHTVDSAVDVAGAAHATVAEAVKTENEGSPEQLTELVDAVEKPPSELELSNANLEINVDPAPEVSNTADQPESATSEPSQEIAESSPVSIGDEPEAVPTPETSQAERVSDPDAAQADGLETSAAAEQPASLVDVKSADRVREVDAVGDDADSATSRGPVSQGESRSAGGQTRHEQQPSAAVVAEHAAEGQLPAGDTADAVSVPVSTVADRSASAMSLVPQTDDDGDGGGSTAASMAKKDKAADSDSLDHEAPAQRPNSLEVARQQKEPRRVTGAAALSVDPDPEARALAEPRTEEPLSEPPRSDLNEPLPVEAEAASLNDEGHDVQVELVAQDPLDSQLADEPEAGSLEDDDAKAKQEPRTDGGAVRAWTPKGSDGPSIDELSDAYPLPKSDNPLGGQTVYSTTQPPSPETAPARRSSSTSLNVLHKTVVSPDRSGPSGTPTPPAAVGAGSGASSAPAR